MGLAEHSFGGFLNWVLKLREDLGIPHTADALGVTEAQVDRLAQMAVEDPSAGTNPTVLTAAEYAQILRKSLAGDLT